LTGFDKNKAMILKDFDPSGVNSNPGGGRARGEEEEEDEGMPRGQRVQCAQQ